MSAGVAATSSSTALAGETPLHGRGSECLRDYRHRCLVVDMPRAVELGKSVLGANPLPALDGNVANNTNEAILAEFNIQCSSPMVPIGNDQLRCCMALDLPQPVIHHLDSCLAMLGQDCAGAQQDLVHLILAPTLVDVGGYPVVEFHDHPELPENMEAVQPVVSIVYVPASGPGKGEPIVVQHDVTKRERGERLLQKGTISHTTLLQRVHAAVSPAGAPLPEGAAYVLLSAEHLPLTSQYAFFPMRLLWSVAVQPRHLGKSAAEAMGAPPGVFQWVTDRFTVTKRQGKYKAYELSHRAPAVRMPALPTAMSVMWPATAFPQSLLADAPAYTRGLSAGAYAALFAAENPSLLVHVRGGGAIPPPPMRMTSSVSGRGGGAPTPPGPLSPRQYPPPPPPPSKASSTDTRPPRRGKRPRSESQDGAADALLALMTVTTPTPGSDGTGGAKVPRGSLPATSPSSSMSGQGGGWPSASPPAMQEHWATAQPQHLPAPLLSMPPAGTAQSAAMQRSFGSGPSAPGQSWGPSHEAAVAVLRNASASPQAVAAPAHTVAAAGAGGGGGRRRR